MKIKNLRKKIRRLEARLQEGAKKLARLKGKLEVIAGADAAKARKKSAARAAQSRPTVKSSPSTQKKKRRLIAKPQVKPAAAKKRTVKRRKRKLNLSPERRAQLAAAMKARWAAKRAAANTSNDRDFTLGQAPPSP